MIRDYQPEDREALEAIHKAQGIDYALYNLDSPLCFVKKVKVEDGKVVAALVLRLTAETILLVDGNPIEKMEAMQELQPEVLSEAWSKGINEVCCVVPPEILPKFDKRLRGLGWSEDREGWKLFSRSTE